MDCSREEQLRKLKELEEQAKNRKNEKDYDNEHADEAKIKMDTAEK